jgi:tRNA threonylcarbamoyladenosine biosynthesis protein TsaB
VKVLALDTATELCSAALWIDGLVSTREEMRPRGHGELILPMIEQLLLEAAITLRQLDAIAFGRGPGAFTGVRLAVSIAQGLGFSAQVPLIAICDLRAVAAQALLQTQAVDRVLVCQDARMDEVYWGCYQRSQALCELVGVESVGPPAAVALPSGWPASSVLGAGSGFAAQEATLLERIPELASRLPQLRPRAREIAQLAAIEGKRAAVAPEMAQPVYLRDEVVSHPNQGVAT